MSKLYANLNTLSRKNSKCSLNVKCILFKLLGSNNMYSTTMWYNCTVIAMKILNSSYNNSLRRLLNIPKHNNASGMFVHINIKLFGELLKNYIHIDI